MNQSTPPRLRFQFFRLPQRTAARPALGLDSILPEAVVQQVLKEEGATWKLIVYTPWLTFWAFFWQVSTPIIPAAPPSSGSPPGWGGGGEKLDDEDTSPYCKARARLPESVPFRLMRSLGRKRHDEVPAEWLWCGRRVKVVDGTTVSMPDTAANQAAYPQAARSGRGWASRSRGWWSSSAWRPGRCWRRPSASTRGSRPARMPCFAGPGTNRPPGDVSLGDRGFSSYFDIALLKAAGRGQRVPAAPGPDQRLPGGAGGWARRITS